MQRSVCYSLIFVLPPITILLAQSSCDPQSAALSLFATKGLNVLEPARDYVKPGGLFFVAKGSTPDYEDPYDDPSPKSGTLTDFKADIMQQTSTKTSTLSAALSFAKTILPLSLNATSNSDQSVSLGEIATTGQRLETQDLDTFLKKAKTSKAASDGLTQTNPKLQVFVVQEIYKATSLKVTGDQTKGFSLAYNNGTVSKCSAPNASGSPGSTSTSGTSTSTSGKGNAKTTASAAKVSGKKSIASKQMTAPRSGKGGSNTATEGTSDIEGGVTVCLSDTYILSMNTKNPVPFAVRLAELQTSGNGVIRKRGARTLRISLGGSTNSQVAADLLDASTPLIENISHNTRVRR